MPVFNFQAKIIASFRNQVSNNVLHYQVNTTTPHTIDQPLMVSMCEAFRIQIIDEFRACLSQESRFEGVELRYLDQGTPLGDRVATSSAGAGPGTADTPGTAPSQVAGLVGKRTFFPGPSGRGRFYMPFVPRGADDVTDLLTDAYLTVLTDLATVLMEPVDSPDILNFTMTPGIMPGRNGLLFKPWTRYTVAVGFATQRRRGFFGRPNSVPPL